MVRDGGVGEDVCSFGVVVVAATVVVVVVEMGL